MKSGADRVQLTRAFVVIANDLSNPVTGSLAMPLEVDRPEESAISPSADQLDRILNGGVLLFVPSVGARRDGFVCGAAGFGVGACVNPSRRISSSSVQRRQAARLTKAKIT
jgi:hypothetical protein